MTHSHDDDVDDGYFDYCSRACEVAHGSDTPSDERTNAAEDATWSCKIGPASRGDLPPGSDAPMRAAVERAFRKLTGHDPEWTFSGWAHDLDEAERAVVEDRLPRPRVIAAAAREQMEQAEAVIGTDIDPEAPERGWEIHEPDDALKITASDDPAPSPTPVPEASGRAQDEELRGLADWLATCAGDVLAYIEADHRITHAGHVERDSLRNVIADVRSLLAAAAPAPVDGGRVDEGERSQSEQWFVVHHNQIRPLRFGTFPIERLARASIAACNCGPHTLRHTVTTTYTASTTDEFVTAADRGEPT